MSISTPSQHATESPRHYAPPDAHAPPRSAAEARALVTAVLDSTSRSRDDEAAMDALLATSELATNAIVHGGGITAFDAEITDEGLDLTIADGSDELPSASAAGDDEFPRPGGYGWAVVRRLAKLIKITVRPGGGKTLSVLLPLRYG